MAVLGADDEDFAGCFDGVRGDGVEVVDGHDAGDLVHESFDEAEVAAGDADDGDDGFGVGGSTAGSMKSWTFTCSGSPSGCHSRPAFL